MTTRGEKILTYAVLVGFALFAVFPLLALIQLAFSPPGSVGQFGISASLSLENIRTAWEEGGFARAIMNSLIVAVCVVIGVLPLSTLNGYAFGTMRFPGSQGLFYFFLLGIILPYEANVIPLYYDFRRLGLINTYPGLILPQVALQLSFGTFWMRAFFRTSPQALMDAARIDGAGSLRILWDVLLPQAQPALLSLAVLVFLWAWNEFLLALVLIQTDVVRTAPLALAFFAGGGRSIPLGVVAAGAVILASPVVAVYVLLQRQFMSGFLSGALTGE